MQIKLNENKEFVQEMRQALKDNDGYCPCVVVKSPETKCMCKAFLEQTEDGQCHCGLYNKTNMI